jgi:hypothetical protein
VPGLFAFLEGIETVPLGRRWRTPDVLAIARACYEDRDFASLPILADALGDAGCDCEELLRHLRGEQRGGPGWVPLRAPHVRGCWAVELFLEKARR